jgi:energy-coupling factor transport system ATP-binding protein
MEIKVENVKYKYHDGQNDVLKGINMQIEEGKIVAVVGRSGSGKTTLLEMFNALRYPTSGKIKIGEFEISNRKNLSIEKLRFYVGILFQFPEDQFLSLTVREELELPLRFYNYNYQKITDRVRDVLHMVGLDESYLDKNPLTLSNGEMRKIALASILILNPSVLVLDEPTIGFDFENEKSFISLIRLLKIRYKKTIIIASHDTELIHKIADYVYVLKDGKVYLEGNKYDVFKEEEKLKKCGVKAPKIITFSNKVLEQKKIKIGYRDDMNDLIKDIYRYVR